jgi:hypothetical protein
MIDPPPRYPKHSSQERLRVSGRDINDQITDAALGDCLKVVADCAHVHAVNEGRSRFEHRPRLSYEFM